MSIDSDLLEQYRMARTKFKAVSQQQETLYHKRQRMILQNSRINAYKFKLIQSKQREWSKCQRNESYRSSFKSIRLSTNIRNLFQVTEKEKSQSRNVSPLNILNTLPYRVYPPVFNIRSIASQQSIKVNLLHEIDCLGQFDRKFIICKRIIRSSHLNQIQLLLFDQHAISERILLERLQTYFKQETICTNPFYLSTPVTVARNPRFLYTFEQISSLERIGFIFAAISTHNLLVRAVPSWILSLGQCQSSITILNHIIQDTIDNILSQINNNSSNNLELIIYETLKSIACHNAIKFNDILNYKECSNLLNELKLCSMPFICAHGRTAAAILWEYDIINEDYTIDMNELKQLASIHKWFKAS